MDINDAKILAEQFLLMNIPAPASGDHFAIVGDGIVEEDGWYFPFQTKKYINTGNLQFSVVGNWPIFVTRDGRIGQRRFGMPFVEDNKI